MKVSFSTNVDCCRSFMSDLDYEGDIAPAVGDIVIVSEQSDKCIEMKVVRRTFHNKEFWHDNKTEMRLYIELNLTHYWAERGISEFEKFLKGY